MRTKNIFIALVLMVAAVLLSVPMATAQNLTPKVHPKSGLYGYWGIKKNGNEAFIIKPKFNRAGRFVNGHAFVSVNGAWYVIGNDGKALLSTTYSKASALSNDHYCVRQGDKYGVVDLRSLAEILPIKYDAINILDGKYRLTINGKYGLADKSGTEILPIMYDAIITLGNAYKVAIGDKCGIVDGENKEIIPIKYDAISTLGNAYKVAIGDMCGIVDGENKEIIPIKYDAINIYDGKYRLTIDGKHGLADKAGKEILPIEYDQIYTFDTNAYKVAIGDKWGIVDKTNKVIVEPKYKAIESFDGGLYALLSDKWIFVDSSGEVVDISDRVMRYTTNNGQKLTKYPSCLNLFCDGVGVLVFTNAPTSIGERAFYGCSSLTSITIPDSVTSIGGGAFDGCSRLTDVITPEQWINIFVDCVSVKTINGKEKISDGSFKFVGDVLVWVDRKLESVSIPASVKSIASTAFSGCENLIHVNVADLSVWLRSGVDMSSSDGWSLYHNGKLVTNVTIPNGVTKIADGQFCRNQSLTSITIPNDVTKIGDKTFYDCDNLCSISIPESVKEIGESAFYSCNSLTSVTISNGVTKIGDKAFYECDNLCSISIPASVKEIGESAFMDCTSLTSVTISNGVTKIGDKAFYDCDSLGSISIPASVAYIGSDVFTRRENCGILYIYMNSATPPALGRKFLNYDSFNWSGDPRYSSYGTPIIYVPENALFAYRSADVWKYMADKIEPKN